MSFSVSHPAIQMTLVIKYQSFIRQADWRCCYEDLEAVVSYLWSKNPPTHLSFAVDSILKLSRSEFLAILDIIADQESKNASLFDYQDVLSK